MNDIRYYTANIGKRILAYIIDFFILFIAVDLISTVIINVCVKPDATKITNLYNSFLEVYEKYLNNTATNEEFSDALNTLLVYVQPILIIMGITMLVCVFLYYVILPYFVKFQTLGRAALKIKVVTRDEQKVSFGRLMLRVFLGGVICTPLISMTCSALIIIIITAIVGYSITDLVSSTALIDINKKEFVLEILKRQNNDNNQNDENVFEGQYKDINNNSENEDEAYENPYKDNTQYYGNNDSSAENDKSSDDDEYTVF